MKTKLIMNKDISTAEGSYLTFDEIREVLSKLITFYCDGEVFHDTISGRGWHGFSNGWVAFADKRCIKPFRTETDLATYLFSKKVGEKDFVDLERSEVTLTLQID